jgi:putative NADPH-quinone reductase
LRIASGFDPCERADHYEGRRDPSRFDVQAEQHHASTEGTIPAIVRDEIARLDRADLLVLQYPMWWHLPPAMLKGWIDRVFIYGEVYASRKRFEHGRFAGKRAMLSLTVGTNADTYAFNGRSGDIDLLLWPVQFSLAYVGYSVLVPFVAYGVEAVFAIPSRRPSRPASRVSPRTFDRRSSTSTGGPSSPSTGWRSGSHRGGFPGMRRFIHSSSATVRASIWPDARQCRRQ